ncbi:hypothetical protein GOODEAATRI_027460, partial [Goodea atripinnis]
LPVTISHAGLVPFLISFLVGFFVQALLVYLFVELLQKCQVVQLEILKFGILLVRYNDRCCRVYCNGSGL